MDVHKIIKNLDWLRNDIIGRNMMFETPFGEKPLVYADYTASGRSVFKIENYLLHILKYYANTHTEDDFTGRIMTTLLHDAEKIIKKIVNAGDSGKIIFSGTGCTGGITRLLQILGVFWSPATKKRIDSFMNSCVTEFDQKPDCHHQMLKYMDEHKPVVFVGPYEHHSNEVMWRQTICDVVEIPLNLAGELDLEKLEEFVSNPDYSKRQKIGSFSAASNVSGIKTEVYKVAKILHKYDVIACFDFAACAPYVEINMNYDSESYFDAIFLSPHKFLGGPGTSGLLIFNDRIYQKKLPPSIAAGGTVTYVTMDNEAFIDDIETREKPGTPGIIQDIKVALVFQLKEKIGITNIEAIEEYYLEKFNKRFLDDSNLYIYGPTEASKKINIISFNIKHEDKILHPKFVTKLFNDLFGIQTRAGCSCAGPYGHQLLKIDKETSCKYISYIDENISGLKPGWVRLNLHYSFSEIEVEYIFSALEFILKNGYLFLPLYEFDFKSGEWTHKKNVEKNDEYHLNFDELLDIENYHLEEIMDDLSLKKKFDEQLFKANEAILHLNKKSSYAKFETKLKEIIYFKIVNYKNFISD